MKNLVGVTFGLVISMPAAAGSVYKWTDDQGQVHFGDKPPAGVTATQEEVRPATGDDRATGGGLRSGERARLDEIRKQESSMAAEKRDREEQVMADEKRRTRQVVQDAQRCANYQQKISDYKRRLRAGCRVSTCNTWNDQLARYKSKVALVCRQGE
jgi:Domain of unknown function (DUF4124)